MIAEITNTGKRSLELTAQKSSTRKFKVDDDFQKLEDLEAKDLVLSLLNPEVAKRPSARQALEHPWLK